MHVNLYLPAALHFGTVIRAPDVRYLLSGDGRPGDEGYLPNLDLFMIHY